MFITLVHVSIATGGEGGGIAEVDIDARSGSSSGVDVLSLITVQVLWMMWRVYKRSFGQADERAVTESSIRMCV